MTYIENIYLCLALPLILSLFFIRGRSRRYALFLVIGMTVCLLSAYVSSFFMGYYGADGTTAAIEITPVCEEGMKLLPLLFFYLIFEPAPQELPAAAIALAAGFATFFFVRRTIPLFLQGRLFTGIMETEAMVFERLQNGGV